MNDPIAGGETNRELTTLDVVGSALWWAGGQVGSAPFYVAGEYSKGSQKAALLMTGAVIDSGFNFGAAFIMWPHPRTRV